MIPAPVLVEVDYWIQVRLHPGVHVALLDDIVAGAYRVEDLRPEDYRRTRELCDAYADSDIGFVDAAVLAVVERLGEPKLATLDQRHFQVLRPRHVETLRLLTEPRGSALILVVTYVVIMSERINRAIVAGIGACLMIVVLPPLARTGGGSATERRCPRGPVLAVALTL